MNFRSAGLSEISAVASEFEDYSLGQILYAIINRKPKGVTLKEWLYTVSDEDLYTAIERTKLIERDDHGIFK